MNQFVMDNVDALVYLFILAYGNLNSPAYCGYFLVSFVFVTDIITSFVERYAYFTAIYSVMVY